jgi:peptidoglycan-N-acetylglucosamine deacetylase
MSLLLWFLALMLHGDDGKSPMAGVAISGVTTHEQVVALTFDACATKMQANGFDDRIFDILMREKIPVTIYMTGTWAEKHPAAVKQIAAATWIEIGNHSYSHPRLTLLQPERLRTQIRFTNRILEHRLGRPALSLRPPAGAWNPQVLHAVNDADLPLVLWSVVSGDAGGHVPPDRMRRTVLEQTKPGGIVIFHINRRGPFTHKVLPDIIAGLRTRGLRFVTVSQLLSLPDAVPIGRRPSLMGYRNLKQPGKPAGDATKGPSPATHGPQPDAAPPSEAPAPKAAPPGDTHENSSG